MPVIICFSGVMSTPPPQASFWRQYPSLLEDSKNLKIGSSYHMITALISYSVQRNRYGFVTIKYYLRAKMKTVIQTQAMNTKSFFYFKWFPSSCLCHLPLNSILLKVNCATNCIHQKSCKTVLKGLQTFIHSIFQTQTRSALQF